MNVASRIIYLREQKGLTTNKLANMAGISQSHLREIELGLRNPTVETLSYFCDALGVTLEEFFREGDSQINPYLMSALSRRQGTDGTGGIFKYYKTQQNIIW